MQTQVRFCLIVPLVCIWPLIANADNSDAATLVSECGTPDLPQSAVDSCLERVRVLEETEPSAQLQALEASLERRESGRLATARAAAAPAASPRDFAPPPVAAREMPAQDEFARENPDPDTVAAPVGSEADDQPPIADPPDAASEDRSMNEQPDDPQ